MHVRAVGPHGAVIPLNLRHGRLWPRRALPTNERVSVDVVVRRPSAVGWLLGSDEHLHLTMRTPGTRVTRRWLTLGTGEPVRVRFAQPVRVVGVGAGAHRRPRVLPGAARVVSFPRSSAAGLLEVAGAPRTWERLPAAAAVSWFPAGATTSAVVSPGPGSRLSPTARIRIAFSRPVAQVLGGQRPSIEPATPGTWRRVDPHTLTFTPTGYGFPLNGHVRIRLPHAVAVVGTDSSQSTVQSLAGRRPRLHTACRTAPRPARLPAADMVGREARGPAGAAGRGRRVRCAARRPLLVALPPHSGAAPRPVAARRGRQGPAGRAHGLRVRPSPHHGRARSARRCGARS